jgi:pilus assembly protein FimV
MQCAYAFVRGHLVGQGLAQKKKQIMKKISRCFPPLLAALASPASLALGLGEIQTTSALGSRLEASIDLYAAPEELPSEWRVDILPDHFAEGAATPVWILESMRGQILISPDGRPYVRVESSLPVDTSNLTFRLRLSHATQALTGRYSVSLAPPTVATPQLPKPRPMPAKAPRPARTLATAPAMTIGAGDYGPVRPGDSLWTIAHKLGGGRNTNGLMRQLFERNPQAFNGSMDRLRVGAVLRLDGKIQAAAVAPPALAAAEPVLETQGPRPGPEQLANNPAATLAAAKTAMDRLSISRSLAEQDPELAARLSALDEKLAAIRARYDTAAAGVSPVAATAAPAPQSLAPAPVAAAEPATPNPAPSAAAAPTPPAATTTPAALNAEAVADMKKMITPAPTQDVVATLPSPLPQGTDGGGLTPYLLLAACSLAAAGVYGGRRWWASRRNAGPLQTDPSRDETLKAEVARKSGNRVRLENEIRALVEPTGAMGGMAAVNSAASQPIPLGASGNEDTVDIDMSIAGGFYAEAEEKLRQVIETAPRNVTAKLRLAEVYYITEQADAFSDLAEELMVKHRKEITDDDWQRLVRMGKMIAPDFPLFSGPKSVGLRA